MISDQIKATRVECFLESEFLSISRVPRDVSVVEVISSRMYNGCCVCLVGWGESMTRVISVNPYTYELLQSSCRLHCNDFPAKIHMRRSSHIAPNWSIQLPGVCRTDMKPVEMHNLPVSSALRVVAWRAGLDRHTMKLIVMFAEFPRPIIASNELASIIHSFTSNRDSGSLVITTDTTTKMQTVAPKQRRKTLGIVGYVETQSNPPKVQVEQIK